MFKTLGTLALGGLISICSCVALASISYAATDEPVANLTVELYHDINGNGDLDAGEPPVRLMPVSAVNKATRKIYMSLTGKDGQANFGLQPGLWTVTACGRAATYQADANGGGSLYVGCATPAHQLFLPMVSN